MAALLMRLARLVPADRRDWVVGLLAEITVLPPGRVRRRWLAGGVWLVVRAATARRPHDPAGGAVRAALAGCVGLIIWAVARYPGVAMDAPATSAGYLIVLLLLIGWYLRATSAPAPRGTVEGLGSGLVLLAAVVGLKLTAGRGPLALVAGLAGLLALMTGPIVSGAAAARRVRPGGSAVRAGTAAGCSSGMSAALVVALGGLALSLAFLDPARDAPSTTPLAIRADPHPLAVAAVGDALAGAINLLWQVPLLAAALGCAAAVAAKRQPRRDLA